MIEFGEIDGGYFSNQKGNWDNANFAEKEIGPPEATK